MFLMTFWTIPGSFSLLLIAIIINTTNIINNSNIVNNNNNNNYVNFISVPSSFSSLMMPSMVAAAAAASAPTAAGMAAVEVDHHHHQQQHPHHQNHHQEHQQKLAANEFLTLNISTFQNDEQILQTIHAISRKEYCRAASSTPSSSSSSSSSSSLLSSGQQPQQQQQHQQLYQKQQQNENNDGNNNYNNEDNNNDDSASNNKEFRNDNNNNRRQNFDLENLETIQSRSRHLIRLPLKVLKKYFSNILKNNQKFQRVEMCLDVLAKVLADYDPTNDRYLLLNQTIYKVPQVEPNIYRLTIGWIQNDGESIKSLPKEDRIRLEFLQCNKTSAETTPSSTNNRFNDGGGCEIFSLVETITESSIWLPEKILKLFQAKRQYRLNNKQDSTEWSHLSYDCHDGRWILTYHSLIYQSLYDDGYGYYTGANIYDDDNEETRFWYKVKGVISADVDVTDTDINQCSPDSNHHYNNNENSSEIKSATATSTRQVINLFGTHKCHNESSECIFLPGHGMYRGGYQCNCKTGFHSTVTNFGPTFNGSLMEQSFQDKHDGKNPAYDYMFTCERCQPGCDECIDNSPCLSSYNWAFRISLLTITIICIIFVFILALNIYRYRRLKVIKVASPIFLCITLLGCVIMYLETVTIFPEIDTTMCVLTKWTRNFGFCLTYSSLLLKTWRVSLTYRVKSAHKIKLTDKQLLQWLFPILLVMVIYLGAWTISDTPQSFYIKDWNNLKFKQCSFNWWDYSLAIGEIFFLLWGIKVCYNVRNAQSLFDEAKYITWAIYNITLVNMVMFIIHFFILPQSGPDFKYFFGFLRTQLSTTTTVVLIFGPKFYRVIKGEGDLWNPRLQARGIAETYAFNGIAMAQYEETTDLYQENDDLKREVQKLAAQLEIMKLSQMQFRNRHLQQNHSKFSKIQHQQSQQSD